MIRHSAAQRREDTGSSDGPYVCTSVLSSFHCPLNSQKEMCKEAESCTKALDNLSPNSRKLSIVSLNRCKSYLLHLESISGYNLVLWPASFVTLSVGNIL